jgi:hypothetical protein
MVECRCGRLDTCGISRHVDSHFGEVKVRERDYGGSCSFPVNEKSSNGIKGKIKGGKEIKAASERKKQSRDGQNRLWISNCPSLTIQGAAPSRLTQKKCQHNGWQFTNQPEIALSSRSPGGIAQSAACRVQCSAVWGIAALQLGKLVGWGPPRRYRRH